MSVTNSHSCVVQTDTLTEYQRAVQQLDEYISSGRTPTLENRIDDEVNLRITFTFVENLDLS